MATDADTAGHVAGYAAARFVAERRAAHGTDPGPSGEEAYDVAQILIAALRAGAADREAVTSFLGEEVQGFQGLTRSYGFRPNGELVPSAAISFFSEVRSGAWVPAGDSTGSPA